MDSYSSVLIDEKNNNRSDPSRMNTKIPPPLARLRPEIFGDAAVKDQILLIQQMCEDIDPEVIALVFHECNQNMRKTIDRLKAGEFQDGEWQTAKSTNKKKNHDQNINGGTLSDSERSLSQRTSPTSSLRSGHRRTEQYQPPSTTRANGRRVFQGYDTGRNQFNHRHPVRTNKPTQRPNPPLEPPRRSEISLPSKQSDENIPPLTSSMLDEYEFVANPIQSLTFDNNEKKISIPLPSKRRVPSAIPQGPVSMHPTVQFSAEPIDVQFGDIQWNDSVPTAVNPSSEQEKDIPVNDEHHDVQDTSSTNYINHQPTNDNANQLSTSVLSIVDPNIDSNNLPIVSPDGTSHLSDHLTPISSTVANQYPSQLQEPIQIPITRLPSAAQYAPNTNVHSSSAFTPFNRGGNYSSVPREYSQSNHWNPQSSNYKTNAKNNMMQTGTYAQQQQQQQPSYQVPPQQQQQQQQIFFSTYQYPPLSPAVVQFVAPMEAWAQTGYSAPLESYPYVPANYVTTYPNQAQYHPSAKYDQHSLDKEFFAQYGQLRISNPDPSTQQSSKDTPSTSKLSPTAATFSQGAPLTASPSATTVYLNNPFAHPMPNYYYPQMTGTDRTFTYPSVDNRDNRHGASNHRTNYYHHGQARTQNNNVLNSSWHSQQ